VQGVPGLGTNNFVHPKDDLDAFIYASNDQQFSDLTVVGSPLIAEGDVEAQCNMKMFWIIEQSKDEYKRMFEVTNVVWVDGILTLDHIAEYPIKAYNENGKHSLCLQLGHGWSH
jgi:hypothetical protein